MKLQMITFAKICSALPECSICVGVMTFLVLWPSFWPFPSKRISVIGTAVVPEFGVAILLLAAALLIPVVVLRGHLMHRTFL